MTTSVKIRNILEENELADLRRFINKRQCLNAANMYLIYIFHIVQAAGVLTTAVATGYSKKELIWVGVGLNILATLIHMFDQTNNNISKKLLQNIISIKSGNYVDEDIMVNVNTPTQPATLDLSDDRLLNPSDPPTYPARSELV
jgi:hypothetical protein